MPAIAANQLRLRILGLMFAQFVYGLVTLSITLLLADDPQRAADWLDGLSTLVTLAGAILLTLHAAAIVGFWLGRAWARHAAFAACSPYLIALAGYFVSTLVTGQYKQSVVPLIGSFLLGTYILRFESAEMRDEVERWRALRSREPDAA
jgi:thiosulfate reductase cytochrome b subunit